MKTNADRLNEMSNEEKCLMFEEIQDTWLSTKKCFSFKNFVFDWLNSPIEESKC